MAKLEGWRPKKRVRQKYEPEPVPFEWQEDEFFSYHTFERVQTLTTRGKLVERFYRKNHCEDDCNAWIACKLDPIEYQGGRHVWWFVHFDDFYVTVELSHYGPHRTHRARLFYRQEAGSVLWLASAQLGPLYFFSKEKITMAYFEVLAKRLFFISEKESNKVVAM